MGRCIILLKFSGVPEDDIGPYERRLQQCLVETCFGGKQMEAFRVGNSERASLGRRVVSQNVMCILRWQIACTDTLRLEHCLGQWQHFLDTFDPSFIFNSYINIRICEP